MRERKEREGERREKEICTASGAKGKPGRGMKRKREGGERERRGKKWKRKRKRGNRKEGNAKLKSS